MTSLTVLGTISTSIETLLALSDGLMVTLPFSGVSIVGLAGFSETVTIVASPV